MGKNRIIIFVYMLHLCTKTKTAPSGKTPFANLYKLVPISNVQADFDLLLNNKLELVLLSGRQADLDLFL